ncbi:enolase-like [Zophobas morio]|uniref:enolase-like n=1 Tax=Zophobas morio TaxID=2755281 RepID=UPI0030830C42
MSVIVKVFARQIYDSRGNPTVEVDLYTEHGLFRASVPSGASTGENEACELRDGGTKHMGKGVTKAVSNVNNIIAPAIKGMKVVEMVSLDAKLNELDGTPNKSKLGANAILGVSMAACRAAAAALSIPLYRFLNKLADSPKMVLPVPCFNVINGGCHAGNYLAPQEFFIIPTGASSFAEAMKIGSETYHHLKAIIKKKYGLDSTAVGDEGGFAPNVKDIDEALELLVKAIESAGHTGKVKIGSDPASSEFYNKELDRYDLDFKVPGDSKKDRVLTRQQLIDAWEGWCDKYPIILIEDPCNENDFEGHAMITKRLGHKVEIVGDDLYCTNKKLVQKGIEHSATNAMLLKVNQIGTVTEAIEAYKACVKNQWGVFVSHRSGETEDTFIADLAVALGAGHIKTGAPCRSERLAKYNQLLRIEEELEHNAPYAGEDFRKSGRF